MSDEPRKIDFGLIQPKLNELLFAAGNWIERSWPGKRPSTATMHTGSRALLLSLVRLSENTWRTVSYFSADSPPDPSRRPEYVLSVTPLSRTVLEALCTTIFIFSDLGRRTDWYYKSGWREMREDYARLFERYRNDPRWAAYLSGLKALIEATKKDWGITPREESGDMLIRRFPIPDRMVKDKTLAPDRREQLQFLLDWHYRRQSQEAHLTWPGLARRSAIFLPAVTKEERADTLPKIRAQVLLALVTLLVALVSEVEIECRFGMLTKARYLWTILVDVSEDAEDVYDRFYRDKLAT